MRRGPAGSRGRNRRADGDPRNHQIREGVAGGYLRQGPARDDLKSALEQLIRDRVHEQSGRLLPARPRIRVEKERGERNHMVGRGTQHVDMTGRTCGFVVGRTALAAATIRVHGEPKRDIRVRGDVEHAGRRAIVLRN